MIPTFTPASDYVPPGLDATKWEQLRPLYAALIDRPIGSPGDLERLILDRSELDAAAAQAGSELYIAMTCHTDDAGANAAYLAFVEGVQPGLKESGFELDRKIAQSPHAAGLDPSRYGVLLRDIRAAVELFRPENVPIETALSKLDQEYSQVCGAMTAQFRGQEMTLAQLGRYQEETDRATRRQAWALVAARRLADRGRIDEVYDRMLELRQRAAANAGFDNYRDYAFKARRRFDYTVADCDAFAAGVERHVVPAMRRLNARRAEALGLGRLRPWDLAVDIKGRPPLRPFADAQDMVLRAARVFERMDPELGALFGSLRAGGSLDLASRKGKAPGGYQATRDRSRLPFIFMNAVGVQRDVETILHEAGHAFHALLCRPEPILAYRSDAPIEFCEVASMTMELVAAPFLDEFYAPAEAHRARRVHLEQIAVMLPWIATIDQFQHWVYTNPGHTRAERDAAWAGVYERFAPLVDWSGQEEGVALAQARDAMWQRQLHLFGMPFYYIEYGIAQLGALQLDGVYRADPARAMRGYKAALRLGGSRPLPELFAAAGIEFGFWPERIERTWRGVEELLDTIPA